MIRFQLLLCSLWTLLLWHQVAGAVVGFGEIDRSVREDDQIDIFVDLFLPSTDNITLRVFPVTLDEFERSYASSFVVSQEVLIRIDEITDPAEYDPSPGGRRDFNNISLEVTFMAGSSDLSKRLPTNNLIINDDITEANEAFLLLMEIVDSGSEVVEFESLGGVLIFNIIDNDAITLGFEKSAYTFSESSGILTNDIRILKINNALSEVNHTLAFSSADVSAQEGADYLPYGVTGEKFTSITFTPSDQILPVPITILKDPSTEVDESFNLFLANTQEGAETGVGAVMPSVATVTIKDEDEIVVGLERTFYNTTEGDVGVLSVCMALLNGTLNGYGASLFFSISTHDTPTDSATNAMDYEIEDINLELMPGAVSRDCAFITIKDDDEIESVESFTVVATFLFSLISSDRITVAPTEALIIINDNDRNDTAIEMTTEPPVVCPTVPSTTPVISSNSSLFNCSTHISDKEPHHLIATCSASFVLGPLENTTCSFNGNPFQFCTLPLVVDLREYCVCGNTLEIRLHYVANWYLTQTLEFSGICQGGSLELGCNVSTVSAEILSLSCGSNRAPTVFTCSVDGSPPRNCALYQHIKLYDYAEGGHELVLTAEDSYCGTRANHKLSFSSPKARNSKLNSTIVASSRNDSDCLTAGAIVGIVLTVIIFLLLLILLFVLLLILCCCFCVARRRGPKVVVAHDAYINEWSTVVVDMRDSDIEDGKLRVEVTGPSGDKIDIQVEIEYGSDDKESGNKENAIIKYLPTVLGKHVISIFWIDSRIRNSPCTVMVKERPSVEVVEGGSMEAVVGIWNQFQVDMQQNKRGKLDVTIRGPGKPEVNVNKRRNGIAVVRYFLTVSGEYYITVLMDGAPIAGSPFKPTIRGTYPTVKMGGDGVPATGTAGKWCTFEVTMSGGADSNIRVEIHGPSKPEVDINYHSTESATVRYRLEQPGEYYITVFFNNEPMNGCPFKTVIEPVEEGNPIMHIGGDGVPATGKAGEWSMFEVTMSGSGQSNIRVEIHGPSKPEVDVNYHSTTSATIRYRLGQPGEYSITVFFNDEAINGCPFKTIIGPAEEVIQMVKGIKKEKDVMDWGMGVEVMVTGENLDIVGDSTTL